MKLSATEYNCCKMPAELWKMPIDRRHSLIFPSDGGVEIIGEQGAESTSGSLRCRRLSGAFPGFSQGLGWLYCVIVPHSAHSQQLCLLHSGTTGRCHFVSRLNQWKCYLQGGVQFVAVVLAHRDSSLTSSQDSVTHKSLEGFEMLQKFDIIFDSYLKCFYYLLILTNRSN